MGFHENRNSFCLYKQLNLSSVRSVYSQFQYFLQLVFFFDEHQLLVSMRKHYSEFFDWRSFLFELFSVRKTWIVINYFFPILNHFYIYCWKLNNHLVLHMQFHQLIADQKLLHHIFFCSNSTSYFR